MCTNGSSTLRIALPAKVRCNIHLIHHTSSRSRATAASIPARRVPGGLVALLLVRSLPLPCVANKDEGDPNLPRTV